MIWQDMVMAGSQVVFMVSLVPALLDRQKPPLSTSGPTALSLAAVCVSLASLGLLWSALCTGVVSIMWAALFAQRLRS